ncbi:MAG TPA: DNA recombination protein RmuC [Thermoanaerobaculia bacterium]|nr:DNA recombination protein RmuC [Thermoanaerobaculia bacterium]
MTPGLALGLVPADALAALVVLVAVAAVVLYLSARRAAREQQESAEQRRILMAITAETAASKALAAESGKTVHALSEALEKRLVSFERTIDERIRASQDALGQNIGTMQKQSAESAKLLQTVGEHLGRVFEASQRIASLATEVTRLEDLLKAPKIRGGLGEQFLEETLRQVLPPGAFEMQKRFAGGEAVDAAIRVGARWVVVDSKFPLENYRRSIEVENEAEKRNARAQFFRDVRRHVETIASKYIRPGEDTLDFALMYVPAEAVYAEIVSEAGERGVLELAIAKKVIPVSPLLFYVYLYTVAIGLKGMEIEQRAQEIVRELGELKRGVSRIEDPLGKLGGHLENARKQFETTSRELARFAGELRDVTEPEATQPALPLAVLPPRE